LALLSPRLAVVFFMQIRWLLAAVLVLGVVVGAVFYVRRSATDPSPGVTPQEDPPSSPQVVAEPLFRDVTPDSGIDFTYRNGENLVDAEGKPVLDDKGNQRKHLAILESLGGGSGLVDYDGDGLLDVFVVGGGFYVDPPEYKTIQGHPCRLYKNLGNLRFEDVTAQVGLDALADGAQWFYSHGVAIADYDRDGWPDLLVTGWQQVALLRNVDDGAGGRKFADVTAQAGLSEGITWSPAAAFGDLDGDGWPDLYVCQYVDWSWEKHPSCSYDGKLADVCPPKNFHGLAHKVYRNNGLGGFEDVSDAAGLRPGGAEEGKGLGVLIVDLDGDLKPDVYVANDTVDNFLYVNRSTPGNIILEEKALLTGVARDDLGSANGSMGLDAGDPERVGKPALWVTNYQNELHALYRNEGRPGQPMFHFRTAGAGIAAIGQTYVGWGTAFIDADLDGWEDLVVTNGHAIRYPLGNEENRLQQPILLMNTGGKFKESSARLGDYYNSPRMGRGLGVGDLDNDGRTDLLLNHMNQPATLLRGIGGENRHWLGVELVGKEHACVVGARVVLETQDERQTRFAKSGGSYCSSGDRRFLFGLGDKDGPAKVTVYWPTGSEQTFENLATGQYHRLVQE
jgi:enediyne biosynthesis protein E4